MKRKQIYITEEQDRRLKRRAEELGVSEAEVIRRALDAGLDVDAPAPTPSQLAAIERFLERADKLRREARPPKGWKFNRAELYEPPRGYKDH